MPSPKPAKSSPAGGELSGLLRRAEVLQKELDQAQSDLKAETIEGSDGSGRVIIKWTCDGVPQTVELSIPGASDEARKALEGAILAALKVGMNRLFTTRKNKLSAITKGMNLPGLFS